MTQTLGIGVPRGFFSVGLIMMVVPKRRRVGLYKRTLVRPPKRFTYQRKRQYATLKRAITSDLQFFDTTVNVSPTTTWTYSPIFLPTAGTTDQSRFGDKTVAYSIRWNFVISPGTSQQLQRFVRVVLYWDSQPNGANPNPDIMSANVLANPNPALRYRYRVLRDFLIPIMPTSQSVNGLAANPTSEGFVQRGLIKCIIPSQFTASTGAITDVATGSIGVATLCDATVGSNLTPSIGSQWRVVFKA